MEPWALLLYCVLQVGRVWVLISLGGYWTTRVITLPGQPLIRKGPYRFLRHPNYLIVACEIALLPIAFHDVGIAVTWSLANGVLLMWRGMRPRPTPIGYVAIVTCVVDTR